MEFQTFMYKSCNDYTKLWNLDKQKYNRERMSTEHIENYDILWETCCQMC